MVYLFGRYSLPNPNPNGIMCLSLSLSRSRVLGLRLSRQLIRSVGLNPRLGLTPSLTQDGMVMELPSPGLTVATRPELKKSGSGGGQGRGWGWGWG